MGMQDLMMGMYGTMQVFPALLVRIRIDWSADSG